MKTGCEPARGFTLLELLLVVAGVLLLLVLGSASLSMARASAHQAECAANLRSLHMVMEVYANDHLGCYPIGFADGASWSARVRPYLPPASSRKEGVTYCPATHLKGTGITKRDATTWRTDYNINRFVASKIEEENRRTRFPQHLIFLFDGNGATSGSASTAKTAPRHRNRINILFVGGYVEPVSDITRYNAHWEIP